MKALGLIPSMEKKKKKGIWSQTACDASLRGGYHFELCVLVAEGGNAGGSTRVQGMLAASWKTASLPPHSTLCSLPSLLGSALQWCPGEQMTGFKPQLLLLPRWPLRSCSSHLKCSLVIL